MRLLALLACLLVPAAALAQGTGTLAGRVIDDTGEGLPGANVIIDGTALGASTDMDGHYRIIGIPVGAYSVTASYVGFTPVNQMGVEVVAGAVRPLDFELVGSDMILEDFGCYFEAPMISNDPFASRSLSGEAIANLPTGR